MVVVALYILLLRRLPRRIQVLVKHFFRNQMGQVVQIYIVAVAVLILDLRRLLRRLLLWLERHVVELMRCLFGEGGVVILLIAV